MSALSQPETREVILIEDASTDRSLELCRRLVSAHSGRIRLFQHPDGRNHGAGFSRNLGLRQAKQPFVAFLDADDYYLPGRFARDALLLAGDPALDGVYNALGTDFLDEKGRQWFARSRRPSITTIRRPPQPGQLFFRMGPIGNAGYFSLDALTLRRRVLECMDWFTDLPQAQDTMFCVQLAARFRLAGGETRTPVAMRGVHAGNRIQDFSRARESTRDLFDSLVAWARTAPLTRRQLRALHQARLTRCPDWMSVRAVVREQGRRLAHPSTGWIITRWALCRRFPDDPLLPGVFPALRRSIAERMKPGGHRWAP